MWSPLLASDRAAAIAAWRLHRYAARCTLLTGGGQFDLVRICILAVRTHILLLLGYATRRGGGDDPNARDEAVEGRTMEIPSPASTHL
ncbi:MAG: hypothetical protein V2A79_02895 [Planctomycetota bacterium]